MSIVGILGTKLKEDKPKDVIDCNDLEVMLNRINGLSNAAKKCKKTMKSMAVLVWLTQGRKKSNTINWRHHMRSLNNK